jgi:hypothetical protein
MDGGDRQPPLATYRLVIVALRAAIRSENDVQELLPTETGNITALERSCNVRFSPDHRTSSERLVLSVKCSRLNRSMQHRR